MPTTTTRVTIKQTKRSGRTKVVAQATGTGLIVRLTDPEVKPQVDRVIAEFTSSPAKALEFLQKVGIRTPRGNLTRKYGG